MLEQPKILVASPVFSGMKYCIKEFIQTIKNLDYENYDILLVDNSKEDGFFEELKKDVEIRVIKDSTQEEKNLKRLVSSRNKILEYAITGNYDYIMMFDSDVIPPKSIISELLSCDKKIISGVYYNYFKYSGKMVYLPCVWKNLSEEEFDDLKTKYGTSAKTRFGLKRHLSEEEINENEVTEVLFCSAGCMLIKNDVFKKLEYEFKENCTDEIAFLEKAKEIGFKIYCNTKMKCRHLTKGKLIKDQEGYYQHPLAD